MIAKKSLLAAAMAFALAVPLLGTPLASAADAHRLDHAQESAARKYDREQALQAWHESGGHAAYGRLLQANTPSPHVSASAPGMGPGGKHVARG